MGWDMVNALAHTVTVVRASWSRSQEWLLCTRVLWDRLYRPRSDSAAQGDVGLAHPQCRVLQDYGLHGYLEQPARLGGYGRHSNT